MSNILGNMPPVFGSGYRGVVPAPSAADVSAQNILRADGTWGATPSGAIPSQTGNATKLLTTDGTNASWSGAVTVSGSNATVGGNLTVSGTGTSAFSGAIKARSTGADEVGIGPYGTGTGGLYFGNGTVSLFNDANTQLKSLVGLSLAGNLTVSGLSNMFGTANGGTYLLTPGTAASTGSLTLQGGNGSGSTAGGGVIMYGGSHASAPGWVRVGLAGTSKFAVNTSGLGAGTDVFTVDQAGNLTVSGTGNSSIAGTLLVATTTNSSNGKIQLADHTTSAGGIGFGTDTTLYRAAQSIVAIDGLSTAYAKLRLYESSVLKVQLESAGGDFTLATLTAGKSIKFNSGNDTTALTLDSSQNATFAGRVISNGTGYGVGANSDANTPFNALTSINGTFGALIKNTNAGSSAFAGINIEADSGQAGFRQYSTAHSVWAGKTLISAPSGGTGLVLLTNGTGDAIDFWTNATQALSIDASQNIVPGTAALATTATNGFIYLQTCAGAPTGVPTTYTGRVASIYDTTNNKLYVYNGGWKSVTLA